MKNRGGVVVDMDGSGWLIVKLKLTLKIKHNSEDQT